MAAITPFTKLVEVSYWLFRAFTVSGPSGFLGCMFRFLSSFQTLGRTLSPKTRKADRSPRKQVSHATSSRPQ